MSAAVALAVAVGGLVGAPARYVVNLAAGDRLETDLPVGTLLVNVSGCLVLGFLYGLVRAHHLGPVLLGLLGTGFCGAYTTFSTFSVETLHLLEEGDSWTAGLNIGTSVVAGLAAAALGVALGAAT